MTELELSTYQQSLLNNIVTEVPKKGEKAVVALLTDTLAKLRAINTKKEKKTQALTAIDGEPIPESLQAIIGVMKPFTKEELDADDRLSYIMSK